MKRLSFLKIAGGVASGYAIGVNPVVAGDKDSKVGELPKRVLGRTGDKVSVVGFPGLALCHYDQFRCNAAIRFSLSQKGVAAAIPPSFLDLLDKAIEAGRSYRPISKAETRKLKDTAATCLSLFQREEEKVARGESLREPVYPDSPHECCPCAYA